MGNLKNLPNIGKELEKLLIEAGIENYEDLKTLGSKNSFLTIKKIDETACLNKLYALEGALENIRWHSLSDEKKKELKDFFNEIK